MAAKKKTETPPETVEDSPGPPKSEAMISAAMDINPEVLEASEAITALAEKCSALTPQLGDSLIAQLQFAQLVQSIREFATDEYIATALMPMMDRAYGFGTDRAPGTKAYSSEGRYSIDVVRECFVDTVLSGFLMVNREMMILQKRPYIQKPGFERRIRQFPGLSDLRIDEITTTGVVDGAFGVTAKTRCRASWKLNGKEDSVDREWQINVNRGQSWDAVLGKAERKLYAAIFDRLHGSRFESGTGPGPEDVIETTGQVIAEEKEKTKSKGSVNVEEMKSVEKETVEHRLDTDGMRSLIQAGKKHGFDQSGVFRVASEVAKVHDREIEGFGQIDPAWIPEIEAKMAEAAPS